MADERSFQVGKHVYVVDWWGTSDGMKANAVRAEILDIDIIAETFTAVLYGDTYIRYSYKDYGRLIFDTQKEADEAANKLPKPKTTIFQKIGKRVYKKVVKGIRSQYTDGIYDLIILLNKGQGISTKELGHSLFLNESDARE